LVVLFFFVFGFFFKIIFSQLRRLIAVPTRRAYSSTNSVQEYMEKLDKKMKESATFRDVQDLLQEMERRKYSSRRLIFFGVLLVGSASEKISSAGC
jgi:hypothetical protein